MERPGAEEQRLVIRCHICHADPLGRWKQPPTVIFHDRHAEGAATSKRGFLYACRDHLSVEREKEILQRERERGWTEGGTR